MRLRPLRSLFVTAFFLLPLALSAQMPTTRPTPEQAQILLQTRPDLVQQLRQRMIASGMTPDQIRARLRAEGYPENLLDAYMPGTTGDAGTPSSTVFGAVRDLGISDSTDLSNGQQQRTQQPNGDTDLLSRMESRYRLDTLQ